MTRLIVVGASAGGVRALQRLAAGLPADLRAAVLVVLHIGSHRSMLPEMLASRGALPAEHARHQDPLQPGRIYVRDRTITWSSTQVSVYLNRGPKEHHTRPAIDPLFLSAALAQGPETIGVILTGTLDDGTFGLQAIKQCGGTALVQDPSDAEEPSMPESALRHVDVDHCVPLADMAQLLAALAAAPPTASSAAPAARLKHEQALMLFEGDAMEHLTAVATPSPFVCPDCHGGLWEITDSSPLRYRCHVGHGFTIRTLQHAMTDTADEAVWNAMRALHEKGQLIERMIDFHEAGGDARRAQALAITAERLNAQCEQLRRLVEKTPEPIE